MRLGLIGCGLIGKRRALAAARGNQVSLVCDRDTARAGVVANLVNARLVADWQEVVRADLDAVMVATSHDGLAEIAHAAATAGKHVLVEKPAGRNFDEVSRVRAAACTAGIRVKVGFNHRFHRGLTTAKQLVFQGALGPLYYIRARYGHGGRVGYENEWRCNPAISGGGELIDQGSHLIDLSRWFIGDLMLDYASLPTFFWNTSVEDNCFLALSGPQGEKVWLHATWTEWKNIFSFEITGRDGKLTVDGLGGSYGLERLTFHKMGPQMGPPETTIWEYPFPDNSWQAEFAAFEAALSGQVSNIADIEDACAVYTIIDAAYRTKQHTSQ